MNKIYGIVFNGVFYGERAELRIEADVNNGICSFDPESAAPFKDVVPANLTEAIAAFRKYSTMAVIRGVSFHAGIVPDQPVKYPKLPLAVVDGQFGEFEYIEVVGVRGKFLYYLQTIQSQEQYVLATLQDLLNKRGIEIGMIIPADVKCVTPSMRVMFGFHLIEARRKLEAEPANVIKDSMSTSGATVTKIKVRHDGYEVVWKLSGHTINTVLDKNFRVMEAGFCTSGGDRSQSARSLPNLLKTYVEEGSYIHRTRQ